MPTARFQPSFAAGVLAPGLHGRIDIAKYDVALKYGKNVFIHPHGGVSNRAGTEFIAEVMDSSKKHRLIPFRRDEDENFIMVMGDSIQKIIYSGAYVQDGGSDYQAAQPYTEAQVQEIDYVQSVDVIFFAHHDVYPQKMSRTSLTSWNYANLGIDPSPVAPTAVSVAASNAGTKEYTYCVTSVDADGVEGFQSASATVLLAGDLDEADEENTITWTGSSAEYNVYRERNGIFGYIGFTDSTTFTDDNISPNLELTPPIASTAFATSSDYPSVVGMFQQRLIFANTESQPETIFASKIGGFENFTRSRILRSDDRIETDLIGGEVNHIRAMLSLRELLVFTSSGEFSVTGPSGTLVATNPIQTQYGYSGARYVKPLVIEDTALFVDRTGRQIRDLRYAFEQDGYSGKELTLFAEHYFRDKQISRWAFAKNPHSIAWVALDDGTLLSLTYKREHQVWAWCEHDLGGEVEDVCVIQEGTSDVLYLIVKRDIGGVTKRYIERMNNRSFEAPEDAFFVDCGVTYSGSAVSSVSGLSHLEGETVVVLADGNVFEGIVVSGGVATLPTLQGSSRLATKIHVGLPYVSEFQTLPPAIELKDVGSAKGRPHNISKVFLQLEKTRGIQVGAEETKLTEIIQTKGDLSASIPLFTGMTDAIQLHPNWNKSGNIFVRQSYPLPMTILGISPEIAIGRMG